MTQADLDGLVARFDAGEISRPEWTHAAHLKVGAWHVERFGPDEALARLRVGIRPLNEGNGVANPPSDGYHETVTGAYVRLLSRFLAGCSPAMPFAERVCALLSS